MEMTKKPRHPKTELTMPAISGPENTPNDVIVPYIPTTRPRASSTMESASTTNERGINMAELIPNIKRANNNSKKVTLLAATNDPSTKRTAPICKSNFLFVKSPKEPENSWIKVKGSAYREMVSPI